MNMQNRKMKEKHGTTGGLSNDSSNDINILNTRQLLFAIVRVTKTDVFKSAGATIRHPAYPFSSICSMNHYHHLLYTAA